MGILTQAVRPLLCGGAGSWRAEPVHITGGGESKVLVGPAGELRPDEGDALVAGHSVISQLSAARQQLGYCPQVLTHTPSLSYPLLAALSQQMAG